MTCLCQLYFSDRNAPIEEVKNAFFDPRHLNDRAPISEEDKTDFARKLHQVKQINHHLLIVVHAHSFLEKRVENEIDSIKFYTTFSSQYSPDFKF